MQRRNGKPTRDEDEDEDDDEKASTAKNSY